MSLTYQTYRSALRHFVTIAGSSLLAVTHASAATYYWDTDGDATAGFGASANGTTWSSAGTGNLWSTSPTGAGVGGGAVADYVTTTSDDLYFGTASIPLGGTVTISGTVNAKSISTNNANLSAGATINFAAAGSYERANNNGSFPTGTTFTGLGTSLTWMPQRNFNVSNVSHNAGSVILSTSPASPYPYPGRTVMNSAANLGPANAALVFNGGTLRLATGFPYDTLSALNADHPVSFVADKDAGFEHLNNNFATFTIDLPVDLGTGTFWLESSNARTIVLTQANTWGQINLPSAVVEVSALDQLGPSGSTIQFGSGTEDLSTGTLRITGTTLSDFGDRNFQTTETKGVSFDIVEAAHTFTLDRVLNMTLGGLTKSGVGTLALSGTTNTYMGDTNVNAGTLALESVSLASPIIVATGASLGLSINAGTPATALSSSSATVNLTNGDVTITNPGGVDGSSDYLLMTATGGFTFSDPLTQLGTAVSGYELALQNADTELWLVVAASGTDYAAWASGFVGLTDSTETLDFDNGGLDSGIEYVLGGDPTVASDDAGKAPTLSTDATNLTFTFDRDQASIHPNTAVTIEVGTDLATWPDVYMVGADTASSTAGVTVTKDTTPGFDTVTLTVPMGTDTEKFARLQMLVTP